MNKVNVQESLRSVAYSHGIDRLANVMGLQQGTLYNKLNPNDSSAHHKIALSEFIQIMVTTGKFDPLERLCALMGGAFFPLPNFEDLSDSALLDIVNKVHIHGGQAHKAMHTALDDGMVTMEEAKVCDEAFLKWLSAILELRSRFNGMAV